MEEALRGVRKHRTLPPTAANGNGRVGIIVLRHLAFEALVLGALGGSRGIGCPIGGGGGDLRVAEQEQLVLGSRHGGVLVLITAPDIVR